MWMLAYVRLSVTGQCIRQQFSPKAAFLHCSAHRLNLVVKDFNSVVQVRNTIKAIIKFFWESSSRRSLICRPNVPLLCETRWSRRYKDIRMLSENFKEMFSQLHYLATNDSGITRQNECPVLSVDVFLYLTGVRTIRRRTIRRGQFGVGQFGTTICCGQFGAKYNINSIENPAFIHQYFSQIPPLFQQYLLTNLASISATFFSNPASVSAVYFH